MKTLVTGASGYVGSRLIPELIRRGHHVVATYSTRAQRKFPWHDDVDWIKMDAHLPAEVATAMSGVDAVYFLIHSLSSRDFSAEDRDAAQNVRDAIDEAGIDRLIYLSGLIPADVAQSELSEHLASRLEVEQILETSTASTLTLRAAIIIGSGSTSFEVIRQFCERTVVQPVPKWMATSTVQPIAVTDVVQLLANAAERTELIGHLDIGGASAISYRELLALYSQVAKLHRTQIVTGSWPVGLVAKVSAIASNAPNTIVENLIASLRHDMVCDDPRGGVLDSPGSDYLSLTESIRRSLVTPGKEIDGAAVDGDPEAPSAGDPAWAGGNFYLR